LRASAENRFTSSKVLVFPRHMAKANPASSQPDASRPSVPPVGFNPQRHGTFAQWAAVVMSVGAIVASICFGLSNRSLTERYHNEANQATTSDEHTKLLVDERVQPKLDKIYDRLNQLGQQFGELRGMLGKNTQAQDMLRQRLEQQVALANMTDPKRVDRAVAIIRTEIEKARSSKKSIPVAEYRAALRDLPDTANGYWKTVAAIINYQSFLDQKVGLAPDPKSVAHWCPGLTAGSGGDNVYNGQPISNCILDLDTTHNDLENLTIRNSVIRYHGGPISVHNVVLMNCYFELDLTRAPNPSETQLLRAILDSPEQKTVALPHIRPTIG
jgi:hypothetical protein